MLLKSYNNFSALQGDELKCQLWFSIIYLIKLKTALFLQKKTLWLCLQQFYQYTWFELDF